MLAPSPANIRELNEVIRGSSILILETHVDHKHDGTTISIGVIENCNASGSWAKCAGVIIAIENSDSDRL